MVATVDETKSLERHGLETTGTVYWNLSPARLYEESLQRDDGQLVHMGAIDRKSTRLNSSHRQ